MENSSKNIIYGNTHQNNYAKFLPICSSVSDRNSVTEILSYVKQSPHFKNYNRITYAYRIEEVPAVFVTEDKNSQAQFYDGKHSDETIQGSGQKLLHLLEKFNIRNVIIAVLLQQYNPLMPFQTVNFRVIVQNSRMLLDELYQKVVSLQGKEQSKSVTDLMFQQNSILKMKKYDIGKNVQLQEIKKPQRNGTERRNHIYKQGKPSFLKSQKTLPIQSLQINFLNERCKTMRNQFEELHKSLTDKEIEQLKYFMMYDKNVIINSVTKMLCVLQGVSRDYLLKQYDFARIRKIELEAIPPSKLQVLDGMLKANKQLTVDNALKANRAIGTIFSIISLNIKFSKMLGRISDLKQKVSSIDPLTKTVPREISQSLKLNPA